MHYYFEKPYNSMPQVTYSKRLMKEIDLLIKKNTNPIDGTPLRLSKYSDLDQVTYYKLLTKDYAFLLKKNPKPLTSRKQVAKVIRKILILIPLEIIPIYKQKLNFGTSNRSNIIQITNTSQFLKFVILLKYSSLYKYNHLIDVSCIDLLNIFVKRNLLEVNKDNEKTRFTLVYIFNNNKTMERLHIELCVNRYEPIPSISQIFSGANWLEREIFDLFGIMFLNHSDLRRILTDYGYKHNPLLKDFPLTGYLELKFNEKLKHVSYERVKLMQEFRDYHFESPWFQFFTTDRENKK